MNILLSIYIYFKLKINILSCFGIFFYAKIPLVLVLREARTFKKSAIESTNLSVDVNRLYVVYTSFLTVLIKFIVIVTRILNESVSFRVKDIFEVYVQEIFIFKSIYSSNISAITSHFENATVY